MPVRTWKAVFDFVSSLCRLRCPSSPNPYFLWVEGEALLSAPQPEVRRGVCLARGTWELIWSWTAEESDDVQGSAAAFPVFMPLMGFEGLLP